MAICTIHIGIGHDDDLVVADLGDVEVLAVAAADRGDQRFDGVGLHHAVQAGAPVLRILPRSGRMACVIGVAALDGGAACGIALHDEQPRTLPGCLTGSP